MKILILGCNGMAGHTISMYLMEQGYDVLGLDRKTSNYVKSVICDVLDTDSLYSIIKQGNFDAIINCIGILNQYAENNKALATFLNAYLPHFLAEITHNTDTQIIQMSTDCVFSGKKGNYTEYDLRDGETFYDRSKALGELDDDKNLTLRNSIIGPDINANGIGLLNWFMMNTVNDDSELNGYSKTLWTGQTTLQLAKTMEEALKEKVHGLINAVPETSISKYELLKLFSKYFRDNKVKIKPVDGLISNKTLKRTRYDFNYIIPDYEVMIKELAVWVKNHNNLYPHYYTK